MLFIVGLAKDNVHANVGLCTNEVTYESMTSREQLVPRVNYVHIVKYVYCVNVHILTHSWTSSAKSFAPIGRLISL